MPLELFFPERGQAHLGNQARLACLVCPVRAECREYRKRTDTAHGIWAGELYSRDGKKEDDGSDA